MGQLVGMSRPRSVVAAVVGGGLMEVAAEQFMKLSGGSESGFLGHFEDFHRGADE